ncbi:MAG: hypothetical protein BWY72_01878 [Bacteroidetes bacterium ADurb.Bin416]|nr:MAG: hypothetical protein BWY72_01878 [Bacteroidetes bacterium ADurb.Bin416]
MRVQLAEVVTPLAVDELAVYVTTVSVSPALQSGTFNFSPLPFNINRPGLVLKSIRNLPMAMAPRVRPSISAMATPLAIMAASAANAIRLEKRVALSCFQLTTVSASKLASVVTLQSIKFQCLSAYV